MKDKSLLASVALFSDLYNNEKYKGISEVLAEYIKGAIVYENKYCLTSNELNLLLQKIFGFRIPESVIRFTIKHQLKNLYETKGGAYYFDTKVSEGFDKLENDYNIISETQSKIFYDLTIYIKTQIEQSHKQIQIDIEKLFEDFNKYLLSDGASEEYSKFISAFVIANQYNADFVRCLNSIKEGIILYQGIKYTPDLNDLGKWTTELTIFLNTELLFSALGYNGIIFQEIFNDFYSLTREINSRSLNKDKKKLIDLRYFEETSEEINKFFQTAELIKMGKARLDPLKPAMKKITDECRSTSEVKTMSIHFFRELKKMGISIYEYKVDITKLPKYNVEDSKLIESLKTQTESSGRIFDEKECSTYLRVFTKINSLRKGFSKGPFENIKYILATENNFVRYLAHNNNVKFQDDDIPFAKDFDYIIAKFWFKLKKGFSEKNTLPKSFDVVTRAKLIISSLLTNSLIEEYENIVIQNKNGSLTKDEAIERSFVLREKQIKPEDLTPENISYSLELIIDDDYLDTLYREKERKEELLDKTLKEKESLTEELENYKARDRQKVQSEKKANYDDEMRDEIDKIWKEVKNKNWKDLSFLIFIFLVNLIIALIPLILKSIKTLNDWLIALGYYQLFIWIPLGLIIVFEIMGRAYFFNRDKLINGLNWLRIISSRTKYMKNKFITFESLKMEYEKNNPLVL